MAAKETFGLPVSTTDAAASHQDATISGTWNISSLKHVEKGHAGQKHKGRLVLLGDKIRRLRDGLKVYPRGEDVGIFGSIATLEAMRVVLAHGLQGGTDGKPYAVKAADLANAYLNAGWDTALAPPHFLELSLEDERGLPEGHRQKAAALRAAGHRVVYPMERCLYGHPLSGHIWVETLYRHLSDTGWVPVPGIPGLFSKSTMVLCTYVDDLLISGSDEEVAEFFATLPFEVGKGGPATEFLGAALEFDRVECGSDAFYETRIHLGDYIRTLVSRFEQKWDTVAHNAWTPLSSELRTDVPTEAKAPESRVLELVGMILWVARVARPDVSFAASRLASRVGRWTPECDAQLARTVGYLKATASVKLRLSRHVDDRSCDLLPDLHSDSSWVPGKCQSGAFLCLSSARGSVLPLAWASTKQSVQADSTAASELIAAHTAIRDALCVAQALSGRVVCVRIDNAAVIRIARKGSSGQLAVYESKPLAIRAGMLRDLIGLGVVEVQYVHTDLNRADACTKALERLKQERARALFSLA